MSTEKREAFWTVEEHPVYGPLYYFAPVNRAGPPYHRQIAVQATLDIAEDGTLAGIELSKLGLPPPPK